MAGMRNQYGYRGIENSISRMLPVTVRTEPGERYLRPMAGELGELVYRIGGRNDKFLILQRVPDLPDMYIQVLAEADGGYTLEHRDGDPGRHFQVEERVRLAIVAGYATRAVLAELAELRAHPEAGKWYMAQELASLLAGSGEVDQAIEVLRPIVSAGGGRFLVVDLLLKQGRVREAVEVVRIPRRPYSPRLLSDPASPPF
jgi:hypothetical protein